MSIAVIRQALEALELAHPRFGIATEKHKQAITALRTVIDHYDQTALELCGECGWRAMIPGDGCLVCARQKSKPAIRKALDGLELIAKHEQGVSWRVRKPNGHIVTIYPAKVCEEAAAALRAHL